MLLTSAISSLGHSSNMDPLSVTASVVTLITVTGSILQHLEHVRSRLDAQSELFTIMNTVGIPLTSGLFSLIVIGNGSTSDFDRGAR